jgi:hypothetical protein
MVIQTGPTPMQMLGENLKVSKRPSLKNSEGNDLSSGFIYPQDQRRSAYTRTPILRLKMAMYLVLTVLRMIQATTLWVF